MQAITDPCVLAGVDLAWRTAKNPSAIAVGVLDALGLRVTSVLPAVFGIDAVYNSLRAINNLAGVAIDALLVMNNRSGQRVCELEVSKEYGARYAACHTSNTNLYPEASSVQLANRLLHAGFSHVNGQPWKIEYYPHPAIIEIFGLSERLT